MESQEFDTGKLTTQVRKIVKDALTEELETVREKTIPQMVDTAIKNRIEPVATALTNLTTVISDITSGYIAVNAKDAEHDEKLGEITRILDYLKRRDENLEGAVRAVAMVSKAFDWAVWLVGTRWGRVLLTVLFITLPIIVQGWSEIPDVVIEVLKQLK